MANEKQLIERIAERLKDAYPQADRNNLCPTICYDDFCDIVDEVKDEMENVYALREQEERDNRLESDAVKNEPLTLDELRQMDGEPVRVVCDEEATKTTPGFEPLACWALIEVCEESIFLTNSLGGRTEYAADVELEDDGITIYPHKPKE